MDDVRFKDEIIDDVDVKGKPVEFEKLKDIGEKKVDVGK